ncbi:MAG: xanthine dehydrogenase family protein molybdopterin-binding subunit, partial [Candidatus Thermoplasmatota archaeon]
MSDSEKTFVEGKGAFVDDLRFPDLLHLKVVRSVYARARILRVKGGITHADLGAILASVGEGAQDDSGIVPHPVLASDYVQYVGQPVAAVLGDDPYKAEDRSSAVDIEYEPLKPVVDPEAALTAEPIHPGTRSNIIAQVREGSKFELKRAPVVLEETLANERVTPNPMETRGMVARYDGSRLTVWASTQSVHAWREGLARSLDLPEKAIRVIGVDTGGAFGSKGGIYPEYVIAAYAAMKHRRAVKWVETRSEHLVTTHQGRGIRATMKVYADRKGTVLGLDADVLVDGGAYPHGMGQFAPGWVGHQISGPYSIRKVHSNGTTVYTNKVPLGPYRGAGRPEAAFFIERMMDILADELGRDPVDVRLQNASRRAFTSPTDLKLPPFRPFLDRAVRELGYR